MSHKFQISNLEFIFKNVNRHQRKWSLNELIHSNHFRINTNHSETHKVKVKITEHLARLHQQLLISTPNISRKKQFQTEITSQFPAILSTISVPFDSDYVSNIISLGYRWAFVDVAKMSERPCVLCSNAIDDVLQLGEKTTYEDTTAHLYCLVSLNYRKFISSSFSANGFIKFAHSNERKCSMLQMNNLNPKWRIIQKCICKHFRHLILVYQKLSMIVHIFCWFFKLNEKITHFRYLNSER